MRTFQRLRHVQAPPKEQRGDVQLSEARELFKNERRWRRHTGRRVAWACLLVLGLAALAVGLWHTRLLADGLVRSHSIVVRAPAAVRVVEVFCQPGTLCQRGDPLLRLETLSSPEERRPLELQAQQRQLRLALAEAGAQLGDHDLSRRADLVAGAEREAQLADAEYRIASAQHDSLAAGREALEVALAQSRERTSGAVDALDRRLDEARALVALAAAQGPLAEFDAERQGQLRAEGIVAERELLAASATREATRADQLEHAARVDTLHSERATAQRVDALEPERAAATLREMDTRIEAAAQQAELARVRRDLWREHASSYLELYPEAADDARPLRALELELYRTELAEAQARLAAWDLQSGSLTLYAEADGVVDEVLVRSGSVVEPGAQLVRYYDPETLEIVAYATPELTHRIERGGACRVIPEGARASFMARVGRVGASWEICPEELPRRSERKADLRLPVTLDCGWNDQLEYLRPGMRVKLKFPLFGSRDTPELARAVNG